MMENDNTNNQSDCKVYCDNCIYYDSFFSEIDFYSREWCDYGSEQRVCEYESYRQKNHLTYTYRPFKPAEQNRNNDCPHYCPYPISGVDKFFQKIGQWLSNVFGD